MEGQQIGSNFTSLNGPVEVNPFESAKVTCLYFSASWCPPCQQFTPLLADFYNEINTESKQLEIVWVTFDEKEEDYNQYLTEMPWLSIPFGDQRVQQLTTKYGIKGIPVLLVLKPNGDVAIKNGKQDVMVEGEGAFDKWVEAIKA